MSAGRNNVAEAIAILTDGLRVEGQEKNESEAWHRGRLAEVARQALRYLRAAAEPEAKAPKHDPSCDGCHDVTVLSGVACSKHGCSCACHS